MRFPFPLFPAEFEIPDDWWREAGMEGFVAAERAYRSKDGAACIVPLIDIEPPFRSPRCPLDWRGFGRDAMISVLRSIAAEEEIGAAQVLELPPLPDISRPPFKYRLLQGMHKFYASIAAGFECLPVSMRPLCR